MNTTVSLSQIAAARVAATWPWYVIRGAGFLAAFLLILLMFSGIGLVTGHTYRLFEPTKAWAIHRALGIALCVSVAVHVLFLLFDHVIAFSLPQILIPFASPYRRTTWLGIPLGSLWVALGVLAMYGIGVVVASSLGWIDSKKGLWKQLHFTSYLVMLFVFIHALAIGSDLAYGTFRSIWILIGILLGGGVLARVWRSGTLKKIPKV